MVHLRYIAFPILTALIWHCTPVSADSIERIEHPDGRVEFTNINSNNPGRTSTKSETVFRYKDDNGIVAYSETRPSVTDFDVISFHCYACDPGSTVNWRTTPLFSGRYETEIKTAAREHDVDPALVRAVIHAESAYIEKALSPAGAQGLMQLMPETAQEVGVQNAMVAADNIRGGVTYLARMLERFEGDTRLATAAYNAGPGTVSRYKGVPPYAETRAYVERVNILRERYASN